MVERCAPSRLASLATPAEKTTSPSPAPGGLRRLSRLPGEIGFRFIHNGYHEVDLTAGASDIGSPENSI